MLSAAVGTATLTHCNQPSIAGVTAPAFVERRQARGQRRPRQLRPSPGLPPRPSLSERRIALRERHEPHPIAEVAAPAFVERSGSCPPSRVGYGRFVIDEALTNAWEERRAEEAARRQAAATPAGRWAFELRERSEEEILDLVRTQLENRELEDARERAALAQAVLATGLPDHWRRGDRAERHTKTGAKKLKARAKVVRQAAEEG